MLGKTGCYIRQGDPLSPLPFCIAEDVLSRSISLLVKHGKLSLINSSRYHNIPSHIMYVDDVMIFCKGKVSSVEAHIDIFKRYAECSGQCINPTKSTIYSGSISRGRLEHLVNILGFNSSNLPFNHLGVPIFKGKLKASHLQLIADKIKTKLKDIDKWSRNFIWSGNIDTRNLVIVSWHKICKPFDEGGLGIRSLVKLNEATDIKLVLDMLSSNQP